MDKSRALRMSGELKGRSVADWAIGDLRDYGKSALIFRASKAGSAAILKLFDPEIVERYGEDVQRERVSRERLLIGKNHPHLVTILDAGEDGGFFYVVMEEVPGKPLSRALAELRRSQIWPLIGQIASAAEYLESLGLAHRDIKPDNINVTDDSSNAVLLDLGVLKPFAGKSVTDSEKLPFIGTLQYSSPEFLKRVEEPTPDGWRALTFYQLGAVLHDMIMGRRIFSDQEEPFGRLVDAVTYIDPEIKAGDVPPELISLARTCLSKKPEHRLTYIKWSEFQPRDLSGSSLAGIKDLVKRNAEAAMGVRIEIEDVAQKQRTIRAKTSQLQFDLQRFLHEEVIGNNLFPPISTRDYPSQNANVATTAFSFASASSLGLVNRLHIVVRTSLVDLGAELVEIEATAFLASKNSPPLPPENLNVEGERLFVGSFEEMLVRGRLIMALYKALARAQEQAADVGDEFLFLKLG
jgi:serine/threonine protein kinase